MTTNKPGEEEKPFMTMDKAEEIVMAAQLGMFHGTRSELAHASLLLKNREENRHGKDK